MLVDTEPPASALLYFFPSFSRPAYFRSVVSTRIFSPGAMNSGTMISRPASRRAGFHVASEPPRTGRSGIHHLKRHVRRQHNVQQAPVEQQGAVFHVFLDEPAAVADLFGAEGQFLERFDIGEDVILPVMIAELDAAVLHVGDRHAFAFRKGVVREPAGLQMAQPRVQFVFGLGGAADVELLQHLRSAVQQQDHAAFEF